MIERKHSLESIIPAQRSVLLYARVLNGNRTGICDRILEQALLKLENWPLLRCYSSR